MEHIDDPSLQSVSHCTIEDLPNELLLGVIQNLDSKNLNTANLVCKRWHSIINEKVGRKLFVGRQCQLVPQDADRYVHTYVDIFEISKIGICECFIGEIVEPSRTMTLWTRLLLKIKKALFSESQDPEFKFPYLVKTLHFDGPIPPLYFESVLRNVVNLSRVELHMTAFCNLKAESLEGLRTKWKGLRELSIWGHKLTDGLFTDFYDSKNIIPNVLTFLSNNFRSLTYFAFEYPFDLRDDRRLSQELFSFLMRHPKLSILRICINIPISEEGSGFETFEDREWIRQAKSVSKQLHLNNFELIVSSIRRVRLAKMWMAFVEQQRDMEIATVLSYRIPPNMLFSICENSKINLKKLFVSRILMTTDNQPVQLNATLVEQCTQLTHLTLEGMLHSQTVPGFTSTKLLPKSLVNLELGGLLLLHSDCHDLFFELPNLETICLTDIGNRGQLGLTIQTLERVIRERRIPTVTVYRSICGEFPALGIRNGDPNSRVVIRQRPYDILEMKLNADGYYENMYRHSLLAEDAFDD